jgi:hypothetical protein
MLRRYDGQTLIRIRSPRFMAMGRLRGAARHVKERGGSVLLVVKGGLTESVDRMGWHFRSNACPSKFVVEEWGRFRVENGIRTRSFLFRLLNAGSSDEWDRPEKRR